MEVQLALVFAFTIQLCHLLERLEHGLHDPIISGIHCGPYFQGISTDELTFDKIDVVRKVFHEMDHTLPFFASQLCLFDTFYLFVLEAFEESKTQLNEA